jgi:hypothetical protein
MVLNVAPMEDDRLSLLMEDEVEETVDEELWRTDDGVYAFVGADIVVVL